MITAALVFTALGFIAGYMSARNNSSMVIIGKDMSESQIDWLIALGFDKTDLENNLVEIV